METSQQREPLLELWLSVVYLRGMLVEDWLEQPGTASQSPSASLCQREDCARPVRQPITHTFIIWSFLWV